VSPIDRYFPVFPNCAPRKKFRQARRYYKNLERKAEGYQFDWSPDHWYDLWHEHMDWRGHGNLSRADRIKHIAAHGKAFQRIAEQAKGDRKYQLFVSFCPHDSGCDAVYVTTENPNVTFREFPDQYKVHDVYAHKVPMGWEPITLQDARTDGEQEVSDFLRPFFGGLNMRFILSDGDRIISRVVTGYSLDHGVPLVE
jgi:hypothetical protein